MFERSNVEGVHKVYVKDEDLEVGVKVENALDEERSSKSEAESLIEFTGNVTFVPEVEGESDDQSGNSNSISPNPKAQDSFIRSRIFAGTSHVRT